MGLALLFPGQGTQHPQMLPWLEQEPEAADVLQRLSRALGDNWRGRLADADWATSNLVAQPLLVGVQLAAWSCIAPYLPVPAAVAGYSVGELAAFSAAGVFDHATALDLAQVRAQAMERSAGGEPTGMLAVRDMPLSAIHAWCERHALAVAIELGPDRAVVGGAAASLDRAARDAEVAGRITPMAVRIASHTPRMRSAAAAFAEHLEAVAFQPARTTVVCNLTGAGERRPGQLRDALARQIASPVLWDACMEAVLERGVTCVLEVGPGTTLSGMWRNKAPEIPARSIDEFRSARAAVEWATRVLESRNG